MMRLLLSILAIASIALAAPLDVLDTRQTSGACAALAAGDAPFSLSCSELASRVEYPLGEVGSKAGGIVFLVHGTGSQGRETWGKGPYLSLLPNRGPGYDIAWFNSPTRSLTDVQVTAEYIAYNIRALAQKSKTGKVFVIGHSQGNINIQWAMAFYPSIKQYISGFSSLAGDFRGESVFTAGAEGLGTIVGPLFCTATGLVQGGCVPSFIQQSVGSRYLAAQNRAGGSALVNTLALYTTYDEIVQPQGLNPTSALPGATNVRLQDLCSPAYITDHFGITVAAPAFYATMQMLTTGSFDQSKFNPLTDCTFLADSTIPNPFVTVAGVAKQAALDVIATLTSRDLVKEEPRLMAYVCEKGAASTYCK